MKMLKKMLVLSGALSVGFIACDDEESTADILRSYGEDIVILCDDALNACKNGLGEDGWYSGMDFCQDLKDEYTAASANIHNWPEDRTCVKAMAAHARCLYKLETCEELDAWTDEVPGAPCMNEQINEISVCTGRSWYDAL